MTITRSQRKAIARAKAIRRERNVRNNNRPKDRRVNLYFAAKSRVYRLWDI